MIENAAYLVTADPARGGTVRVTDKRTGAEVLAGPGNELVIQDEYAQHPTARRGSLAPVAQGPRARFGLGPGHGAAGSAAAWARGWWPRSASTGST